MATADTLAAAADAAYADAKILADQALVDAQTALTTAETAIGLTKSTGSSWSQTTGGITADISPADVIPNDIVPPLIPTNDFSTEIKQAFDYAFSSFNDAIRPQITNYIADFFPDISESVKSGSDTWLISTLSTGKMVPSSVEDDIWNRARNREDQEAVRMEQEIIDASASRGFSAPPGVLNHTIAMARERLALNRATISRDIAIKSFDIANENTKIAIQQSVSLRTAFVGALGDFIKVAMVQPNNATEYAKTILASKTGLYDSAVRLYSAQIDEERMRTDVLRANRTIDMNILELSSRDSQAAEATKARKAEAQANVAIQAAEQLGRVAAAAMATRNSMVSVSAGV